MPRFRTGRDVSQAVRKEAGVRPTRPCGQLVAVFSLMYPKPKNGKRETKSGRLSRSKSFSSDRRRRRRLLWSSISFIQEHSHRPVSYDAHTGVPGHCSLGGHPYHPSSSLPFGWPRGAPRDASGPNGTGARCRRPRPSGRGSPPSHVPLPFKELFPGF